MYACVNLFSPALYVGSGNGLRVPRLALATVHCPKVGSRYSHRECLSASLHPQQHWVSIITGHQYLKNYSLSLLTASSVSAGFVVLLFELI